MQNYGGLGGPPPAHTAGIYGAFAAHGQPGMLHHAPALFGGSLPPAAAVHPNFTPSVHALTLAERLAGKIQHQRLASMSQCSKKIVAME